LLGRQHVFDEYREQGRESRLSDRVECVEPLSGFMRATDKLQQRAGERIPCIGATRALDRFPKQGFGGGVRRRRGKPRVTRHDVFSERDAKPRQLHQEPANFRRRRTVRARRPRLHGRDLLAVQRSVHILWRCGRDPRDRLNAAGEKRSMSKQDAIELEGTVTELLPNATFRVTVPSGHEVLTTLAGNMRRNRIRVLAGDRVTVEVSPYDLTRGRITFRHKN